ncbi:MAG: LacI family DNA-binding transcriptional regulator [Pseudomonadota bacterium]
MTKGSGPALIAATDSDHERPTLKTIAAATGLAIATVSRALNDAPDIGEETKRRVRETASQLGYRPNRAALRLRTGKTNVIAVTLSTVSDMSNPSQLIYSIADALRGTSYHLVVTPFFPDQDPMDPIRYIVETESADGIVLNQTTVNDRRVRYLSEKGFPFVTHGRTSMGIDHPYFDFDNESYARIAVRALHARGRANLLLVRPPADHSYSVHMTEGFVTEAQNLGLRHEIMDHITSDTPADDIEAAVLARFLRQPQIDGILTGSPSAAVAAVAGAEKAGKTIGRDFDIVSKEAHSFLRRFRKEIIVVKEDVGRAGAFLSRALMAAIERRAPERGQYLDRPDQVDLD